MALKVKDVEVDQLQDELNHLNRDLYQSKEVSVICMAGISG